MSLVPLLEDDPVDLRTDMLLELPGQTGPMPVWWAVRTRRYLYVELQTGERELYDLTGRRGPPDPFDLQNVPGSPPTPTCNPDWRPACSSCDSEGYASETRSR